jgi:hypothetical protein
LIRHFADFVEKNMAEGLGNEISESCFALLGPENSARKNIVITLLTMDGNGFPRVCLLSPFQVLSTNKSEIYLEVHPNSHTRMNLEERKKATMIMPEELGLLYVRGETNYLGDLESNDQEFQSLFSMKVVQVTKDISEAAPITSHMTFDLSAIGSKYQKDFGALLVCIKSIRNYDLKV